MEELEQRQFIGPEDGKKPRQVLVTEEQYREFKGLA
jgi:DNA segregation ATPase FtsK/SpoIIIE-like protein